MLEGVVDSNVAGRIAAGASRGAGWGGEGQMWEDVTEREVDDSTYKQPPPQRFS